MSNFTGLKESTLKVYFRNKLRGKYIENSKARIKSFFSAEKRGSHLKKHSKRELVNAVLHLTKTGCQWRLLPKEFPNYVTVWSFYRRAIKSGLWEKILVCRGTYKTPLDFASASQEESGI